VRSPAQISMSDPARNDVNPKDSIHFCRGCGAKLPIGFRGHFHKECLRADKRKRICEQRRRERERCERWLQKQHCVNCGAKYHERSEGNVKNPCEASRATQGRD
jgi:hypothetical protein